MRAIYLVIASAQNHVIGGKLNYDFFEWEAKKIFHSLFETN